MSVTPENPVFPNPVLPKSSVVPHPDGLCHRLHLDVQVQIFDEDFDPTAHYKRVGLDGGEHGRISLRVDLLQQPFQSRLTALGLPQGSPLQGRRGSPAFAGGARELAQSLLIDAGFAAQLLTLGLAVGAVIKTVPDVKRTVVAAHFAFAHLWLSINSIPLH